MKRRALFVAGKANPGEKPLWERDLVLWARGLDGAGFDRLIACVLDGNIVPGLPDFADVLDARRETITRSLAELSLGLGARDELWLIFSNHGSEHGCVTRDAGVSLSVHDVDAALASCDATQVIVGGQCGAGHFAVAPRKPSLRERVVLAACGYMNIAGRVTAAATHGEWLLLVGLALFPSVALDPLAAHEEQWRDAARGLAIPVSLESAYEFARTKTIAIGPRAFSQSSATATVQCPQLFNGPRAAKITL